MDLFVPFDSKEYVKMTGNTYENDDETEEAAADIIEEAAEMGDRGAKSPPEGQMCARCEGDAVPWPGDEWLCEEHQREYFEERHG
ncbi:hypothetical protein [Haloarchaeobius sp. HME9146]|uniref:hypothetical protein n=1 Tax=Haloarchaeobius sp. HME9146 TaxID=2978732 RepID=UPI0021C14A24|nr:hypothetical protein [Haloarchaeobius sp. HME9146]MCT9096975.1 hypothetical protein [Haloarchaeobius sp. HME9146]